MRPKIAINCDVEGSGQGGTTGPFRRDRAALYTDYLDAIYDAGAEPVILPPDPRALGSLEAVDGVLLTGGDDYLTSIPDPATPPARFTAMHPRRESFDHALVRETLSRDLPLLAICAGLQLVVIEGGGRIYGDIDEECPGALRHRRNSIDEPHPHHALEWHLPHPPGVPAPGPEVMSHHHQGVAELPEGWRLWACSSDGVIEGAVGPGRWQVAVQWHPELSPRTEDGTQLFAAFVAACRTAVEHSSSGRPGR